MSDAGVQRAQNLRLSRRLSACATLLPARYTRLVDVGCDHARLGIYELLSGKCERLLAIDREQGPLAHARANLDRWGLCERAFCLQNDGLIGLTAEVGDHFVIAGLGGLEMCDILSAADGLYAKAEPGTRLVLQPTKSLELLRLFLLASGFRIVAESLVEEQRRFYVSLACELPAQAPQASLKPALLDAGRSAYSRELRETKGLDLTDLVLGPLLKNELLAAEAGSSAARYLDKRRELLQKLLRNAAFFPGLGHVCAEKVPAWL